MLASIGAIFDDADGELGAQDRRGASEHDPIDLARVGHWIQVHAQRVIALEAALRGAYLTSVARPGSAVSARAKTDTQFLLANLSRERAELTFWRGRSAPN